MLKVRRVSGIPCVSLRHTDLGSFAVPQEWTDWRAHEATTGMPLIIDAFDLSDLAEIVEFLESSRKGD